ncbi:conjugal transfer protein TraH [Ottowia sp.]|uniref:conjugal transfer protein TraH n=1 Tax=Ottowia sp. TaxID=1898956 RepID=UPI0025DE4D82|nr:conjugal transfer protein TraH [Ottowia sp.]MBK6616142.1 conjugal transfer protein TraH [Ottowia sp.]
MKSFLKKAVVVLACEAMLLGQAHATFMDDFFTSAGAAVNVTPAQVRQTGSGSFVTGGSVVWRVPNRTFTPFLWQPPSLKSGCGGIDLYLGSFGFANTAQFVNFMRNVGQNALGLFFKMALKSMSPELEGAIAEITAEINKFNNMAKSSCEAAQALVGATGLTDTSFRSAESQAQGYERGRGAVAGVFEAMTSLGGNLPGVKAATDAAPQALNAGGKKVKTVEKNYIWVAMNSGTMSDFPDSMKQIAMSLIGAQISKQDPADPDKLIPQIEAYTIHMEDLVGTWDQATVPIRILTCNETDQCLSPAPAINNMAPFARIAYNNLIRLRNKIVARTPLDATDNDAVAMLGMTSVPMWKILELTSTPGRVWLSDQYIMKYSQLIGYELAIGFVNTFSTDLEKSMHTTGPNEPAADVKQIYADILLRLSRLRAESAAVKAKIDQNVGGMQGTLAELQHLERTLYQNMSTRMMDNLKYASR